MSFAFMSVRTQIPCRDNDSNDFLLPRAKLSYLKRASSQTKHPIEILGTLPPSRIAVLICNLIPKIDQFTLIFFFILK